jgi:hypothetical protein
MLLEPLRGVKRLYGVIQEIKANPLRWDRVRLNLPGEETYDPTLPWLSKVVERASCERLAGDFVSYIDDIRTSGGDAGCGGVLDGFSPSRCLLRLPWNPGCAA